MKCHETYYKVNRLCENVYYVWPRDLSRGNIKNPGMGFSP